MSAGYGLLAAIAAALLAGAAGVYGDALVFIAVAVWILLVPVGKSLVRGVRGQGTAMQHSTKAVLLDRMGKAAAKAAKAVAK